MTVNRTTLLDLPLPVTGTESGTWGNVTNNGLTQYLDIAIAGALSVTSSVTLDTTEGDSAGTNIAGTTAQYRTLLVPASGPSGNIVITAPASNRTYHVVNLNATHTVQVRAGAGTGVTIGVNQSATVAFDGTDYTLVGTYAPIFNVDNLRLDGNTISSTNTNGNIELTPNGSGRTTVTNLTTTSPRIVTSINDTNGNEVFGITATGSAVNELTVANAATGNNPAISATGSDTNIGITLTPKGTGGVVFPAGAVGTPAITTSGDPNTGIFFPAADQVAIATNGAERVEFGNSETVFNDGGANVDFRVEGDTDANLLFVDASADAVGIGTSNPSGFGAAVKLSIAGGTFPQINFSDSTTPSAAAAPRIAGGGAELRFSTNNAERMRITSSGSVGIGTSSPAYKLDVFDSGGTSMAVGATTGKAFLYADDTGATLGSVSAIPLRFSTNGTERARITSSGDLLVGTTTAVTDARAVFNRASGVNIVRASSVLADGESVRFQAISGVPREAVVGVYRHSGNNGAGYIYLQEEDSANAFYWTGNDGNFRVSTAAGDIGTNGGTVVGTQTSDERLKNISGPVTYGLNEVLAIEPIAFSFKDRPDFQKLGFSAQQVQTIVPEAVYDTNECIDGYDVDPENKMLQTPKSDRTKLAMEYTQLIPVLVNAVKELKAELDTVKAELATLKG